MGDSGRLLTARDVAERLQISRSAAYELMGRLRLKHEGAWWRDPETRAMVMPESILDAWIDRGGDRDCDDFEVVRLLESRLRRPVRDDEPCTYVVRAEGTGLVKIGLSRRGFGSRLPSLQASSPVPITPIVLFRGADVEERLHAFFAEHRRHSEWFVEPPVVNFLGNAGLLRG